MNGSRLLDTNIIISLFKGDPEVLKEISEFRIYVPSIVIGELRYGAEKSKKGVFNHTRIDELLKNVIILNVHEGTGRYYGKIKNQLRSSGRPIPENDIWIAAISVENDISLVTRDGHFTNIEGIKLESW